MCINVFSFFVCSVRVRIYFRVMISGAEERRRAVTLLFCHDEFRRLIVLPVAYLMATFLSEFPICCCCCCCWQIGKGWKETRRQDKRDHSPLGSSGLRPRKEADGLECSELYKCSTYGFNRYAGWRSDGGACAWPWPCPPGAPIPMCDDMAA